MRQLRLFVAPSRGARDGGGGSARRAVTFVDNHDFRDGDTPPIVNDKLLGYAFILTHPGYPCVFWQDYFERGLGRAGAPDGIAALVGAHERHAGGDAVVRYVNDNLYIMERTGWQSAAGLVFVLNNRGDAWNGTFVETSRANTAFRPVAWWGRDGAAPEPTSTAGRRSRRILGPPARLRRLRPGIWPRTPHPPSLRLVGPSRCAGRGAEQSWSFARVE